MKVTFYEVVHGTVKYIPKYYANNQTKLNLTQL
jgi:hypothetical protein